MISLVPTPLLALPAPDAGLGGTLGTLAIGAVLALAGARVDRRLETFLQGWLRALKPWQRRLAATAPLCRAALWALLLVLWLSVAARLSPSLWWLAAVAGAGALALGAARPAGDLVVGLGQALGRHVTVGEFVGIGSVEGQVTRVGLRAVRLRTLDGMLVDVPQSRVAREGLRRLVGDGGGHPVRIRLPMPADAPLADALEEARLAAALAPHAHLGGRPQVAVTDDAPPHIEVRGWAIDPFSAPVLRGEVATAFREAMDRQRQRSGRT